MGYILVGAGCLLVGFCVGVWFTGVAFAHAARDNSPKWKEFMKNVELLRFVEKLGYKDRS